MAEELKVRIGGDIKGFKSAMSSVVSSATSTAKKLSLAFAGTVIAVSLIGEKFHQALIETATVAQAYGKDLEDLEHKARELGKTTAFTAAQAAAGMYDLASAGLKTAEIITSVEHAMKLAGATNSTMTEATGLLAATMKQFGMEASESRRITDTYSAAITNSQLTMGRLIEAMKFAGTTGSSLGWTIEQTTAAVAQFANLGLEGGMAGTNLRMAMMSLAKQTPAATKALREMNLTFQDVNPEAHDFGEILETLGRKGMNVKQAMDIFTARAALNMKQLSMQAAEGKLEYVKLVDLLRNSQGTTALMYDRMMSTFGGQWKVLFSAIQELSITTFGLYQEEGQKMFTYLSRRVVEFSDYIGTLRPLFKSVFESMRQEVERLGGVIQEWWKDNGEDIKKRIPELFNDFVKGAKEVYHTTVNMVKKLGSFKESLENIWDIINQNPAILEFGLIGLAIGGMKGAALMAGMAHLMKVAENLGKGLGLASSGVLSFADLSQMSFKELSKVLDDYDKGAAQRVIDARIEASMLIKEREKISAAYIKQGETLARIQSQKGVEVSTLFLEHMNKNKRDLEKLDAAIAVQRGIVEKNLNKSDTSTDKKPTTHAGKTEAETAADAEIKALARVQGAREKIQARTDMISERVAQLGLDQSALTVKSITEDYQQMVKVAQDSYRSVGDEIIQSDLSAKESNDRLKSLSEQREIELLGIETEMNAAIIAAKKEFYGEAEALALEYQNKSALLGLKGVELIRAQAGIERDVLLKKNTEFAQDRKNSADSIAQYNAATLIAVKAINDALLFAEDEVNKKKLQKQKDYLLKLNDMYIDATVIGVERIRMQGEAELAQMDNNHKKMMENFAGYISEKKAAEEQYELTRAQIVVKNEKAVADARVKIATDVADDIAGTFKMIADAGGKSSREAFAVYKAISLASAIIGGAVAIQEAWKSAPWPWNIPAVALTTAKTAMQVATIQGAQPSYGEGGISQKPEVALVGEKGPEAHVPLRNGKIFVSGTYENPIVKVKGHNIPIDFMSKYKDRIVSEKSNIKNLVNEKSNVKNLVNERSKAELVRNIVKDRVPSYDEGGVNKTPGTYYAGIPEAHIPLKSGKVPVKMEGSSDGGNNPIFLMNNPVFQDQETQRQVFSNIARIIVRKEVPATLSDNYSNDGVLRRLIRSAK